LSRGFFKRNDLLPIDKQMDKLLAKVAKGFDFLVLWLAFALRAHNAIFFIGRHFNQCVLVPLPVKVQIRL
jgi:hypothetical protein